MRYLPKSLSIHRKGSRIGQHFFKHTDSVIPELNTEILNALDEKSFEERAFSWRGRNTVLRNLAIMEKKQ